MAEDCYSREKLLIIWENHRSGKQRALETIRFLSDSNHLRLCLMEEDTQELEGSNLISGRGREVEDIEILLSDISMVVLPTISNTLLQNLADGTTLNLLAEVVLEALYSGIPVKAYASGQDLLSAKCTAINSYQSKRRQLFDDCGIELLLREDHQRAQNKSVAADSQTKLINGVMSDQYEIITEEDILNLAQSNKKMVVLNQYSRITPLAMDTAKDLGMEIKVQMLK